MEELVYEGFEVKEARRRIKEWIENGSKQCYTNQPRNVVAREQRNHLLDSVTLGQHESEFYILNSLTTKLAMKYPQYTFFVAQGRWYGGCSLVPEDKFVERAKKVIVFAGDEAIGMLRDGKIHTKNDRGVEIRNRRIEKDVMRGNEKKTTNIKTAMRLFGRYVYPRTMKEIMEHASGNLCADVTHGLWKRRKEYEEAQSELLLLIKQRLDSRDPALMQYFSAEGNASMVDNIHNQYAQLDVMAMLEAKLDNGGQHIYLKGDEYFTWRRGESSLNEGTRHKREDMPYDMRTALALLKLSEPHTCVQGAGYKLDDTNYFIYDEVQLEFDD